MTAVAILGAGPIGGAAARALATSGRVGRVLLVDSAGNAAAGKALDILQSGAVDRFHTSVEGTDDTTRVVGCSVCVVADRFLAEAGEWRDDEGLTMLARMLPYLGSVPIVFAGAAQTGLLVRAATESAVDRRRLIGSAPAALASSVSAMVAMDARCSPRDVALTVLGVPPSGFVVPWSEASIDGLSLLQVLSPPDLSRLEARVARLWPPGPYGLGVAASKVAEAALNGSRRFLPVLTWLTGEYGVRHRPGVVQAQLSPLGIARVRAPELTTRERVQLQVALGG